MADEATGVEGVEESTDVVETPTTDETPTDETSTDVIEAAGEAADVIEEQQLPPWASLEAAPEIVQVQIGDEIHDVPVNELVNHFGLKPNKFKMKVDKEEQELDWDTIQREVNRSKSSARQLTEASKMRQQMEAALNNIQQNPEQGVAQLLQYLGHDFNDVAEKYLTGQLERRMMDPKERELVELKEKVALEEQQRQAAQQQAQMAAMQKATQEHEVKITNEINEALKTAGLPQNPTTFNRVLQYMGGVQEQAVKAVMEEAPNLKPEQALHLLYQNGFKPAASNVIDLVRQSLEEDFKALLQSNPDLTKVTQQPKPKAKIQGKQKVGNAQAKKKSKMTQEETKAFWDNLGV